MHRRTFLGGAAAALAAAPAFGQSPSAPPKVFLHYTQEELDAAYDQAVWAPNLGELQRDDGRMSAEVRKSLPPRIERYGPAEIEQLDIFAPAGASNAPVMVYIHGGAWLFNTRLDASFPAPTVVGSSAVLVVPDYANANQIGLPGMIDQCRRAIEWTVRNAASFGGDPRRVYVGGHSAGGHLASCMLITDWAARGMPADTLKGGLVMSGMYELHPVMLSSRSKYVKLTPAEQAEASAMRHLYRITCPVAVTWAVSESPEFRRQGIAFADALQGMGRLASRTEISTANHFTEPRQLDRPDSQVSRVLLSLMKS